MENMLLFPENEPKQIAWKYKQEKNMKKILITGSSGFIGRNVKEYLEKKADTFQIFFPSSKELDCLDEEQVTNYLKKEYFDYVLHFAVYVDRADNEKDRDKILEYNLRIFMNFAKNSDWYGKMYYAGSGAEYDKRFPIIDVIEEEIGKHIPVDQYGLMKYTIGRIAEGSSNIYNFRLFGVFGKYEQYQAKFISNICCKAIKGLPLSIRQNVYFDYLWIEDFCRMLEYFLVNEPKYHTYNMGSGKKITLRELCDEVMEAAEKELPVFICKDGMSNEYTACNDRFMEECPEFRFTPVKAAVKELYHWYEQETDIDIYKLLY